MLRRSFHVLRPAIMTVAESVKDIRNGATVASGGFGFCGFPFELLEALNAAKVKDLTMISGTMSGSETGFGPLARDGQISKVITTYVGENPVLAKHLFNGEFAIEFCPMGTLIDRLRAAGAGLPAFYTPTGYGTAVSEGRLPVRFVPGGSMKVAQYSTPRETRQFNGRWCTLETALPADYAFVRAWRADKRGNLVFRGTTQNFNLASAKAAKVCIAEVEEIVECGELDPKTVHLPGVYVHRLVCPPNIRREAESVMVRRPGFSSGTGKNARADRNVMARRAVLEIKDGMTLNLGIGVPTMVASYIPAEMDVVLQSENGLLGTGPFPLPEEVDPDVTNAGKQTVTMTTTGASVFDSAESFGMMRGGHLDLTMLGALEVAGNGDIASWYVPGKLLKGMGGAMDLVVCGCKTIVLIGHTDKKGKSRILNQCTAPVTGRGCIDMIITELAVFEVKKSAGGVNSLVLMEIAEGVTLEEVTAKTEAAFTVSPSLKTMPLAPVSKAA
ncbi:succinyl-coa:3-ketoacid-coenzyme a transferase- like protein [Novymonas esmeraldas]|uniref:Succinyl-CoA:3-ketoacid-coenzyme A transferase n=1 Tax=Novymonas esmeraldas TaxID=1808958 RepID=A0AAW0F5I6_9TRYP